MLNDDVMLTRSSAVPSNEKSMIFVIFGCGDNFLIISISFNDDFSSCCEWFVIRFKAYLRRVEEFSTRSMLEKPPEMKNLLCTNSSRNVYVVLPTAILSIIVYLLPDISIESLMQMQLFSNILNPMLFISLRFIHLADQKNYFKN